MDMAAAVASIYSPNTNQTTSLSNETKDNQLNFPQTTSLFVSTITNGQHKSPSTIVSGISPITLEICANIMVGDLTSQFPYQLELYDTEPTSGENHSGSLLLGKSYKERDRSCSFEYGKPSLDKCQAVGSGTRAHVPNVISRLQCPDDPGLSQPLILSHSALSLPRVSVQFIP